MWLELQIFGFRALWSPYYLIFVLGLCLAYYLITIRYRYKFGVEDKPTGKQIVFFYLGMVLLYIVKGSPVDLLTHIMLTAHMAQLAIYFLIFPILMIKGIPVWIWKRVVNAPIVKPILKLLTKPIISLLLFNVLFSIYHIPVVFDFTKSSPVAHTLISTIILVAAFIVWFPVLAPLKEFDTMSPILKIGYIFANGVLITPACVLIIFANVPLYAAYSQNGAWIQALALCVPGDVLQGLTYSISGPQMFSPMGVMEDQQLGGIIMKIMQEATYLTILGKIFFSWFTRESLKVDPIPDSNAWK
ncbi:cytochrome c oxidase assembly factor CtaG [Virgibacillus sp. FSP13]